MLRGRILPFIALVALVVPSAALARGGGGHGGGGHGGGGHGGHGGSGGHGGASHGNGRGWVSRASLSQVPGFHGWDSQYEGHGFFGLDSGTWVWFEAPWLISPQYPGWLWVGPQTEWDDEGDGVDGQQGYWAPAG